METAFVLLIVLVAGWDVAWYLMGIKPLSPWRAKRVIGSGRDRFQWVDVRTNPEYRWFHIAGSSHRPDLLTDPDDFHAERPDAPIVIVCMTGHRSPVVAYRLKKRGFTNIYNLTGGMLAYRLFGGRVVRGSS